VEGGRIKPLAESLYEGSSSSDPAKQSGWRDTLHTLPGIFRSCDNCLFLSI
jgi:hypothetical protein